MEHQWTAAVEESVAAVGTAQIYLEKELINPRHVEIQILADSWGHCISLGERDCTVQRRRQKLIEEAPSGNLSPDIRERLADSARRLAVAAGYRGVGTAEFLLDERGAFYFMEFNSRIQVEHTVTEWVSGVDLVAWQLKVAAGEKLTLCQEDVVPKGHAIQARIVAEHVAMGFAPSPGLLTRVWWPQGPGIRVDAGVTTGDRVSPFYDSLLGKVIAWGETRDEAIRRLERALQELQIEGVHHAGDFLLKVIQHPDFRAQTHVLGWLEQKAIAEILSPPPAEARDPERNPSAVPASC
jgi:acetyl/propionyl-CoA carboxylase alpha subunit